MEVHMTMRHVTLVLCGLVFAVDAVRGLHAQTNAEHKALTPTEMTWETQGMALAGMEQAKLVGDPSKPGPYTIRLKFPAGYRLAPHTHPDYREVTILSGTFYTGHSDKFDAALIKALPAGSFYTEPANLPHFIEAREPVTIQVSGTGPSGRKFVSPAADSPK
jgi:quercetin dioxygenase-like cupin family protein